MKRKIGIIGAMDIEVDLLRSRMAESGAVTTEKSGGLLFGEGAIGGVPAVVVKSGVGKVNAALCAQRLILQYGVTHVINTGVAGAAAAGLGIFDMVVSTDAVYHDMDATGFGYKPAQIPQMDVSVFPADSAMIAAAKKAFALSAAGKKHKIIEGRIASGDQFISDGAVKRRIVEICAPACVEMEGAAVAHACYLNGTPYVVLRCMSDMAEDVHNAEYAFNEKEAAEECAAVVAGMLEYF